MKKISLFFTLSALFLFNSCERKDIAYEKTYSFENKIVVGAKPLLFEFENGVDTFQTYNVCLEIKHEPKVTYSRIPIELGYYSPSGDTMAVPIAIPVYNQKYEYLGEMQEDSTVKLTQTIFYGNTMQAGKNVFSISPASHNDSLYGIHSIKLSIEKVN
ncbi:MAG: hypothetical protein MJ198_08030 [Bacteroidales bacterium]|nr:hypothetical protein [Bacteroidales bacterium]